MSSGTALVLAYGLLMLILMVFPAVSAIAAFRFAKKFIATNIPNASRTLMRNAPYVAAMAAIYLAAKIVDKVMSYVGGFPE